MSFWPAAAPPLVPGCGAFSELPPSVCSRRGGVSVDARVLINVAVVPPDCQTGGRCLCGGHGREEHPIPRASAECPDCHPTWAYSWSKRQILEEGEAEPLLQAGFASPHLTGVEPDWKTWAIVPAARGGGSETEWKEGAGEVLIQIPPQMGKATQHSDSIAKGINVSSPIPPTLSQKMPEANISRTYGTAEGFEEFEDRLGTDARFAGLGAEKLSAWWRIAFYDTHRGNLDSALKAVERTLKWRMEYNWDSLETEDFSEEIKSGKLVFRGKDKEGNPILNWRLCRHKASATPEELERNVRFIAWTMAKGIREGSV
ncbi:hypothetical protein BDK51DRAFT_50359 [Blyttiomyces helicus]|uniref:CRAL/TRIO N-terminal domain-containing protein n=1 Tax=Blyttiomyces helicus TaxID=388810 RepID=A0A4P9VW00_9FUNG|nr:hypothetical protein BDK51DRAFT_50359 [Blyttiomyces helicus]|eukprot:RKO83025.1 hypothetical protein BDK51DRAFT_50359 [Blyttiomyces helicus]